MAKGKTSSRLPAKLSRSSVVKAGMAAKKGVATKAGSAAERIRAFVALDLDPMSLRRVVRVSDRLRMGSGAPSASWSRPASMHVTLKFLGDDFPLEAVAPLGKALAPLADGKPPPAPAAFRLDALPSVEDARVVAVELDDASGELAALAAKIDKLAARHGVALEKRGYRPHVTLARLKRPYDARRWVRPELTEGAGVCTAASLTLYRSEPGPDGSVYVPLARYEYAPRG
jgi:2'-5' RNA ligase